MCVAARICVNEISFMTGASKRTRSSSVLLKNTCPFIASLRDKMTSLFQEGFI